MPRCTRARPTGMGARSSRCVAGRGRWRAVRGDRRRPAIATAPRRASRCEPTMTIRLPRANAMYRPSGDQTGSVSPSPASVRSLPAGPVRPDQIQVLRSARHLDRRHDPVVHRRPGRIVVDPSVIRCQGLDPGAVRGGHDPDRRFRPPLFEAHTIWFPSGDQLGSQALAVRADSGVGVADTSSDGRRWTWLWPALSWAGECDRGPSSDQAGFRSLSTRLKTSSPFPSPSTSAMPDGVENATFERSCFQEGSVWFPAPNTSGSIPPPSGAAVHRSWPPVPIVAVNTIRESERIPSAGGGDEGIRPGRLARRGAGRRCRTRCDRSGHASRGCRRAGGGC